MESSAVSALSAQVVSNVSLILRDIVVRGIGDELRLTANDVALAAPVEQDSANAGRAGISLFVYHVRPEPSASHLRLELCYMVVPHESEVRSEQKLSLALAKLFHAFSTIHVSALPQSEARNELLSSGNARLKLVAQYPDMDVMRRVWPPSRREQAIKSALYYRVLPVFLPAQANDSLTHVRQMAAENRSRAL